METQSSMRANRAQVKGSRTNTRSPQSPQSASITEAPASRIAMEVQRIRELLVGAEFGRALAAAEALLADAPGNRDALYIVAACQRHLRHIPKALATLARLEELHPKFSRLFQERGQCYVALRSAGQAIEAFEHAVHLSAALPASWKALQGLYQLAGRVGDADIAASHVAKLATLPAEIVTASAMFADGNIIDAERIVRRFLLTHGNHIEGMRLLAKIGMDLDILDDAEVLLESVLALAPDYHAARHDYVVVLLKRHKHVRAREELDRLLALEPDNRVYRTTAAAVCMGFGEHERALPLYRNLSAEKPKDPDLHLSVAHALKTLGRTPEAIESYRAAAAVRPNHGEAYWSLANLKTYRFTDEELTRMRREEATPGIGLVDRYHLCFALGKALEDRCEYGESYGYYERGNELKKAECRYRPEIIQTNVRLQISTCTLEFFGALQGVGCDSAAPIFIVGLPRSGSTLLEQILASHSKVEGTTELEMFLALSRRCKGVNTTTPSLDTRAYWRSSQGRI